MYFKSIEIYGFKSFAEKTVLEFLPAFQDRNSITAIVGPNGSGKSNVSDAIRWVMGEQSMKILRGKKSEDVIFSGSIGKGKMGMASVTLTFDNKDHRAPIDYDELIISRKLYRTGESEYAINGQPVRLFDLQILLAKAQFAHGSYSVIGQGTIDKMLFQSASERKSFFDEAVGIKEFQIKRHQAILKLNRSKEHIAQAEMLQEEIAPRLKSLSRQVKKLEQRQTVEVNLRNAQEVYYVTLWHFNTDQILALQDPLTKSKIEYNQLSQELKSTQEELATLARSESRQDIFIGLQDIYQGIVKKKTDLERERAVLEGRLHTEYSKAGKQNVAWLEQKVNEMSKQETQLLKDIEQENQSLTDVRMAVIDAKQHIDKLYTERTQLRSSLIILKQQAIESKSQQSSWQFSGFRAVQSIMVNRDQFGKIFDLVARLGRVDKQFQLALDIAAGSYLSSVVVADASVAESCIQFLRHEQMGVATFLPLTTIRGRYVPNDIDDILNMPSVHGLALDLVRYEKQFDDIFSFVFGSTVVVDDIATARKIGVGRVRMVTLEGDILERSGSLKGGYRKKRQDGISFSDSTSIFSEKQCEADEKKIDEEQRRLDQLEITYETVLADVLEIESKVEIQQNKVDMLKTRLREVGEGKASLEQELSLLDMSESDYSTAMADLAIQKKDIDNEITFIEKELSVAQAGVASFNEKEEQKKQRIFLLQDIMQQTQDSLNILVDKRNTQQVEVARLETKQEDVTHECFQELKISVAELVERVVDMLSADQLEKTEHEIQKLKYQLSLIGGIDEEVIQEYKEIKTRHDKLDVQLTDLYKTIDDLNTMIADLDALMKKQWNKTFKQIKKEFTRYFKVLFDGGDADLIEVYENDTQSETEGDAVVVEELLEENEILTRKKKGKKILSGIEVKAVPPGKKVTHLRALSGGEQTLTSLALLCAILRNNPSPFVVLDEVEAALDEANSLRLTHIIQELSETSQFILITHNRAIMHTADALYGVSMGQNGMSKLLSVKFENMKKTIK